MQRVEQILDNIKSLEVQGATNVAKACLEGMKVFAEDYEGDNYSEFQNELKIIAWKLANSRTTEPLARNLVRFVLAQIPLDSSIEEVRDNVLADLIMNATQLLDEAKKRIIENGAELLSSVDALYTHCHSSTAEGVIIGAYQKTKHLKVYNGETRPRYQGRKTAKHLVEAGIDTTLVVDGAASGFILSDEQPDVDAVVVGADEITVDGDVANKVGTLAIAITAKHVEKPLYVATTLLKIDLNASDTTIEQRNPSEIWEDAPAGLEILNPAFDLVPSKYVTAFITEVGIVGPEDFKDKAVEKYPWLNRN